jgi:hypothetical protein
MAGIDKTYTASWDEYCQLLKWARAQKVSFKSDWPGERYTIEGCIYERDESDFGGREVPVMNTPCMVDRYLIRKCPLEFVQIRMKEVYGEEDYLRYKNMYKRGTIA